MFAWLNWHIFRCHMLATRHLFKKIFECFIRVIRFDAGSRLIGLRLPLKDWRSNPSAVFYSMDGFSAIFFTAFSAVGRARSEVRKLGIQFESRTFAIDESLNEWHVDAMRAWGWRISLASAMLFWEFLEIKISWTKK